MVRRSFPVCPELKQGSVRGWSAIATIKGPPDPERRIVTRPTESPASPPLDAEAFLRTLRGDAALAAALAALFLSECPRQMDAVRRAVAAGDAKALEQAAHLLRGSVSNFVATEATAAAARLEAFGRAGDLSLAAGALRTLEAAIERLTPALLEFAA